MQDKLITLSHHSTGLEDLIQKANDLIRAAKAPSTRKAYQSDFRIYDSWCTDHDLTSLPSAPETIALYIASCVVARLAPATIARRLASISKAHQAAGFEESPASTKHFIVSEVLKGARRTLGVAQKCKDPLLLNDEKLENLLSRLRAIPHVEFLRIGTRIPIFLPQRITPELCRMLKRFHPLWMSVHSNHPKELTSEVRAALEMLADHGIPLGNQSVL